MEEVVAAFKGRYSVEQIRAGIEELRARGRAAYQRDYGNTRHIGIVTMPKHDVEVPYECIADRERRYVLQAKPRSLIAAFCNDPPFELSALAEKQKQQSQSFAPSIVHDPLDDVFFAQEEQCQTILA